MVATRRKKRADAARIAASANGATSPSLARGRRPALPQEAKKKKSPSLENHQSAANALRSLHIIFNREQPTAGTHRSKVMRIPNVRKSLQQLLVMLMTEILSNEIYEDLATREEVIESLLSIHARVLAIRDPVGMADLKNYDGAPMHILKGKEVPRKNHPATVNLLYSLVQKKLNVEVLGNRKSQMNLLTIQAVTGGDVDGDGDTRRSNQNRNDTSTSTDTVADAGASNDPASGTRLVENNDTSPKGVALANSDTTTGNTTDPVQGIGSGASDTNETPAAEAELMTDANPMADDIATSVDDRQTVTGLGASTSGDKTATATTNNGVEQDITTPVQATVDDDRQTGSGRTASMSGDETATATTNNGVEQDSTTPVQASDAAAAKKRVSETLSALFVSPREKLEALARVDEEMKGGTYATLSGTRMLKQQLALISREIAIVLTKAGHAKAAIARFAAAEELEASRDWSQSSSDDYQSYHLIALCADLQVDAASSMKARAPIDGNSLCTKAKILCSKLKKLFTRVRKWREGDDTCVVAMQILSNLYQCHGSSSAVDVIWGQLTTIQDKFAKAGCKCPRIECLLCVHYLKLQQYEDAGKSLNKLVQVNKTLSQAVGSEAMITCNPFRKVVHLSTPLTIADKVSFAGKGMSKFIARLESLKDNHEALKSLPAEMWAAGQDGSGQILSDITFVVEEAVALERVHCAITQAQSLIDSKLGENLDTAIVVLEAAQKVQLPQLHPGVDDKPGCEVLRKILTPLGHAYMRKSAKSLLQRDNETDVSKQVGFYHEAVSHSNKATEYFQTAINVCAPQVRAHVCFNIAVLCKEEDNDRLFADFIDKAIVCASGQLLVLALRMKGKHFVVKGSNYEEAQHLYERAAKVSVDEQSGTAILRDLSDEFLAKGRTLQAGPRFVELYEHAANAAPQVQTKFAVLKELCTRLLQLNNWNHPARQIAVRIHAETCVRYAKSHPGDFADDDICTVMNSLSSALQVLANLRNWRAFVGYQSGPLPPKRDAKKKLFFLCHPDMWMARGPDVVRSSTILQGIVNNHKDDAIETLYSL